MADGPGSLWISDVPGMPGILDGPGMLGIPAAPGRPGIVDGAEILLWSAVGAIGFEGSAGVSPAGASGARFGFFICDAVAAAGLLIANARLIAALGAIAALRTFWRPTGIYWEGGTRGEAGVTMPPEDGSGATPEMALDCELTIGVGG